MTCKIIKENPDGTVLALIGRWFKNFKSLDHFHAYRFGQAAHSHFGY